MALMNNQRAGRGSIGSLFFGLLLGLIVLGAGMAQAQGNRNQAGRSDARQEQATLSPAQAAQRVQQQYGGKIIKVQARNSSQGKVYRVQLLQDSGRMRNIRVDAHSGAILN